MPSPSRSIRCSTRVDSISCKLPLWNPDVDINAAITIVCAIKLIPSVISFDFAIIVWSQLNLQLFPLSLEPIFASKLPKKKNLSQMDAWKRRLCVCAEWRCLTLCLHKLSVQIWKGKLLTLHRFPFARKERKGKKWNRKWLPVWAAHRFEKCLYSLKWDFQKPFYLSTRIWKKKIWGKWKGRSWISHR